MHERIKLAEKAADDLGAGAVVVHGGHEVGEPVAQVVHFPVQALDVAARLLEQLRRRRLHIYMHSDQFVNYSTLRFAAQWPVISLVPGCCRGGARWPGAKTGAWR